MEKKNCPDCQAKVGKLHNEWCDVEQCPDCGGQFISCGCESMKGRMKWTGEWPNKKECREYGLWCKWDNDKGWVKCSKDDPKAREDLNTLHADYKWDKKLKKFVK